MALAFGCSLDEFTSRVPSWEMPIWAAYYELEPWGGEIEDWRAGVIASIVGNVNGGKKNGKAYSPYDFFPDRKKVIKVKQSSNFEDFAKVAQLAQRK